MKELWRGIPLLGVTSYLGSFNVLVPAASDALGWSETPLPLPASLPVGATVHFQAAWLNTPTCGAPAPLSASRGLSVVVQAP